MVDWWSGAANGLWIAGLAVLLSMYGYRRWLYQQEDRPNTEGLLSAAWYVGVLMVAVGWGLGRARPWWERAFCLSLACWFAVQWLRAGVPGWRGRSAGPSRRTGAVKR